MDPPPPLALYVHLPWCIRKCPYCDFNSYELKSTPPTLQPATADQNAAPAHSQPGLPESDYVAALLRDLETELPLAGGRPIETIFIGGGTPSLFSGKAIRALLDGVRERAPVAGDAEITLEANPGAVETSRFESFLSAGVNRLSIGVQSLRDEQLRALGRVHDAGEAIAAVAAAQAAGFTNVNVDIMYGLPGDSLEGSLADLAQAIALGTAHLSWYQLTLEPNTHFERHPPPLPDEDTILTIEERGRALLEAAGFGRYEVSAFARPGLRCRHNLNYWQFGDYLGIGAGAHGKLTLESGAIERRSKARNPRTYLATAGTAAATATEKTESADALALEFLMNALRLTEGVEATLLTARTGQALAGIEAGLAAAREKGWLTDDANRLRTTPAGLQSLNRLLALI